MTGRERADWKLAFGWALAIVAPLWLAGWCYLWWLAERCGRCYVAGVVRETAGEVMPLLMRVFVWAFVAHLFLRLLAPKGEDH